MAGEDESVDAGAGQAQNAINNLGLDKVIDAYGAQFGEDAKAVAEALLMRNMRKSLGV